MKNEIKYKNLKIKEEENIKVIDKTLLVEINKDFKVFCGETDYIAAERRHNGVFRGKAIYLSSTYDWVLGVDDHGILCLVPLRKMARRGEE